MFSALMFILKVIGLTIVICGSIKKAMNVWAIKRNPRWPVSLFVNSVSEKKLFCGSLFSPILAILYIVFFYTFLYHFFEVIYSWFNQLAGLAHQSIAGLSTPFLQNILNSLVNWIMSPVNFVLLLNLITIWIFIFLKRIYIPIFDRLFRKIELQNSGIIELFFVFREDTKKWFLRNRFLFVRKMYQIVYVFVALGLMFYFASEMSNSDSALQFVGFYPVLILIALEEILYFLGSPSQDEKEEFYGEDDYSNRIVNYDSLRNVFQKIFPSRIVSNEVIQSSKDSQSSFDILDRFSQSENKYEKLAGIYYSGLKQSGKNLNVNYLLMSDNIMLKKNVLVANPFYRDLTEYVLFPIYLRLLEKENILVVLGSDSSEKDFRDWLSNGFEEISHIPNLWRIENINQDTMDNYEIGILRFSELYNSGIIEANKSFFDSVGLILLVNPSQILATGQIGLNVVAELCNTGKIKSSIVAIDSLRDGLVDSLSHVLQQEFVEVFAPSLPTSSSSELIWRSETNSENDNMQAKILPSISRYLGMGTEIATTAIKNQVSEVDWFANEQFPVTDMKWIAGQYYPAITEYAEIDQTQEALSLHLNAKADMWSAVQKNNSFTIVEDEISNAYQIINLFKCRGIEQNFINVISHNYLLRSYMIANQKIFINDNKAIPAITSDFVRSERNLTYKIAFKMMSGYVLDSQIEKELDIYGVKYLSEKGVDKILELFEKYFKLEKNEITDEKYIIIEDVYELDSNGREFKNGTKITWDKSTLDISDNQIKKFLENITPVYFYDEEEVSGDNYIGSKLYGLVHQRYQPKQYITFSGKYYFIDAITPKEGVALKRASDRIESRLQYRNIKTMKIVEYSVDNSETGVINYSNYSLRLLEVDFGIKNNGYYEMEDLNNLEQSRKTEFENPNIRNYSLKTVEQIKFNKKIEDAERESICLLLNEIFRTIFPYDYFYIFATTLRNKKSDSLSNLVPDLEVGKSCKPEDLSNSIFIVEDSDMDLGLLEAVVGNLERLMGIVYSYLKWYQEAQEAPKSVADLKNQKIKLPDNWQPNLENQMIEKMGEISKIRSQIDRKLHGKDRKYGKDGVNDSPQNSLVNTPRTKKLSIFKRVKLYFQRLGKVDGKTYEQWNWEMIEIGNRLTEKLSQTKGVKTTNKVKDILNKNNKPNQKVEDNSLKEEGQSE